MVKKDLAAAMQTLSMLRQDGHSPNDVLSVALKIAPTVDGVSELNLVQLLQRISDCHLRLQDCDSYLQMGAMLVDICAIKKRADKRKKKCV